MHTQEQHSTLTILTNLSYPTSHYHPLSTPNTLYQPLIAPTIPLPDPTTPLPFFIILYNPLPSLIKPWHSLPSPYQNLPLPYHPLTKAYHSLSSSTTPYQPLPPPASHASRIVVIPFVFWVSSGISVIIRLYSVGPDSECPVQVQCQAFQLRFSRLDTPSIWWLFNLQEERVRVIKRI